MSETQGESQGESPLSLIDMLRASKRDLSKCKRRIAKLRLHAKDLARSIDEIRFQIGVEKKRVENGSVNPKANEMSIAFGDSWRNIPISLLGCASIGQIGEKRSRLLIRTFSTVGDLEDFRVNSGLSRLPGFSIPLQKRIETRLLSWLRRYAPDYRPPASA